MFLPLDTSVTIEMPVEDQTSTSMEDRKQRITRIVFQWVGIPLMFGFVGFFFIGPSIGGGEKEEPVETQPVQEAAPVLAVNIDEPEDWIPPSPPQGSPIVDDPENEEEATEEDDLTEEDRPIPPPMQFDGEDGDEAGLGGMRRPPVKDDTDGDDDDDGDDDGDAS